MDNELRRALQRRISIRGGFARGRNYQWHCDIGDQWRTVHWEIARTLRRGSPTFHICVGGQPVDMRAIVPTPDDGALPATARRHHAPGSV